MRAIINSSTVYTLVFSTLQLQAYNTVFQVVKTEKGVLYFSLCFCCLVQFFYREPVLFSGKSFIWFIAKRGKKARAMCSNTAQ